MSIFTSTCFQVLRMPVNSLLMDKVQSDALLVHINS